MPDPSFLPQLTDREFMVMLTGSVVGAVVAAALLLLRAIKYDKAHDKILRHLFPDEFK